MKKFLLLVFIVVISYFVSPLVSAGLFYGVGNAGIFLANTAFFVWFWMQNAWAFIIENASLVDNYLCCFPVQPFWAWGIVGLMIGFLIAFILSIIKKKRSYVLIIVGIIAGYGIVSYFVCVRSLDLKAECVARLEQLGSQPGHIQTMLVKRTPLKSSKTNGAETLKSLPKFSTVFFDTLEGKWAHIRFNSLEGVLNGYVEMSALQTIPDEYLYKTAVVISRNGANIRAQPNTNGRKLASLRRDTEIKVGQSIGEWYLVRLENESQGYIHKSCIEIVNE